MTETERAWLAGLLEGEGCFTTTAAKRRYGAVYLISTDEDVVARAAVLMDCNVMRIRTTSTISRKPQFRAVVQGEKAARVIKSVLPLLGERRTRRATEILSIIEG